PSHLPFSSPAHNHSVSGRPGIAGGEYDRRGRRNTGSAGINRRRIARRIQPQRTRDEDGANRSRLYVPLRVIVIERHRGWRTNCFADFGGYVAVDIEEARAYCLSFPHVTEEVLWGSDLVFKIGGKMFAVIGLDPASDHCMSFKCTPKNFAELTERNGIVPAPYVARYHWIALESFD